MNKKRFLVEFDESLKTYKPLGIPVPTVRVETDNDDDDGYRYCHNCESDYIEGEDCNCEI